MIALALLALAAGAPSSLECLDAHRLSNAAAVRMREPLWVLQACRRVVASRHGIAESEAAAEDVANLI